MRSTSGCSASLATARSCGRLGGTLPSATASITSCRAKNAELGACRVKRPGRLLLKP